MKIIVEYTPNAYPVEDHKILDWLRSIVDMDYWSDRELYDGVVIRGVSNRTPIDYLCYVVCEFIPDPKKYNDAFEGNEFYVRYKGVDCKIDDYGHITELFSIPGFDEWRGDLTWRHLNSIFRKEEYLATQGKSK